MSRPEFVDNRAGNTLAGALRARLEHLALTQREPVRLDIATGYFNPGGFAQLADILETTGGVRLLLGAEPIPPPAIPVRHLGEPRGDRLERKRVDEALALGQEGLLRDRDRIEFSTEADATVRRMLAFLRAGRMEVRRFEKRFLHGKAFIFSGGEGVLAGSSNFTAAGLSSNLELNLGHYGPHVTGPVAKWFEDLWADAVPFDLAALYESRYAEYSPYQIYLRVLWERYGAELVDEAGPEGVIHLTRFQTDGLSRAKRILERYNGVLIADSVGLGKTFMAGELLREVIERRRQRALLIAPAALRDGTWARFKSRHQLGVEIRSFEQVASNTLDARPEEYALIVVDEAHAYRHSATARSQALRRLLQGDPPKQVVLMTATPVNNSLWDLHALLRYFIGHDAAFADRGIASLRRRFELAAKEDPFSLKPDVLFDVLDATTVRRTRHFVKRFYPNDTIVLPGGIRETIRFPRPHVESRSYDLDLVLPGFFERFAEALAPQGRPPDLTMARYMPSRFRRGGEPSAREAALVGLIRSGLLKRFESSARAFTLTVERMLRQHEAFLEALRRGVLPAPDSLAQIEETDSDEAWEDLLREGIPLKASEYDVAALQKAVKGDIDLLRTFHTHSVTVTQEMDPKLELLIDGLRAILRDAESRAVTDEQQRNLRKVIVFSYFADTVEWIAEHLERKLASDPSLAAYRGRLAVVRGTEGYAGTGRREAVYGFAPRSTEAPENYQEDKFDILVTTDVLAEGMNLQQAARIINYDLPWNPMRLVQRHGRIDRIGSPHEDVYLTCVFPDRQLERLLALEHRIRVKLAQASASIGLESEVIPGITPTDHVFADDLREIARMRAGDASLFENGGETATAHSGEEYRQELRKGLERYGDVVRTLPGGAGSGLRRGGKAGHFFCARVDDRVQLRFVPLDGSPIQRDALACLSRIACTEETERHVSDLMRDAAFSAWSRARKDIFEEWTLATDPANLHPDIRPLFREVADHLRSHRPAELTQERLDDLLSAVEAPWDLRTERSLREVFDRQASDKRAVSMRIVEHVAALGMQPWKAPKPLPPIDLDEITLVVWMAVEE